MRGDSGNAHIHSAHRSCKGCAKKIRGNLFTESRAACFSASLGYVPPGMNKTVIEVQVRAVLPTSGGLAGVLWENSQGVINYVGPTSGTSVSTLIISRVPKAAPTT